MNRSRRPATGGAVVLCLVLILCNACNRYQSRDSDATDPGPPATPIGQEHEHPGGAMGGWISSIGSDQYHAEAVLLEDGVLAIYVLAQDETQLYEVAEQTLTAYVKPHGDSTSVAMLLRPDPLPGDAESRTSRFSGEIPQSLRSQTLYITMPGLRIDGERFTVRFQLPQRHEPQMPQPIADKEAAALYLTAGGRYTEADIEANGSVTAAEKYAGFRAEHDASPDPGDPICPISRTKAHPACSWIIGGETYLFSCQPCIDEFLALAKRQGGDVLPADQYVQPAANPDDAPAP